MMERSLIILKPDALQRGLVGPIITRIEQRGLRFIGLKMMHIDTTLARRHYGVHEGKPFFAGLVDYITSGPVVVIAVSGKSVIEVVRSMVGATNPVKAAPGTIRGDLALDIGRNLIHASDTPENGEQEVGLFFRPEELLQHERSVDRWITE
jgi:nucleoside-diphosphate kinase